ncbi:MAG: polynucleotide adenylyltransferase PcnB [Thiomicrorhabdus chilensis]|uniref:polynucleotide adenylyltransferase PcnB n=1 Tax=Thiomicrorhabdus chilensis TaxID=63656 RepID=UPI00299E4621|nr:polynucleotide adenylyltransferase PcnB [Thiomicrorhabdus chilensis]MDX1348373.1 polynucleotide adenylyltransferase PcnB [Thiomicrorhabdus chilensis]
MQRIIRKITSYFSSSKSHSHPATPSIPKAPKVIPRSEHGISRREIDKSALDVLYGLKRAGFEAYLVGGCVRDLLLGLEPKDFDVVTNAEPEEVKEVFKRRCQLIGRRFRLAHVRFGRTVIEVATFRGQGKEQAQRQDFFGRKGKQSGKAREVDDSGRLLRDNVYGTIDEDVWRRDFTVNALYYNIKDFSIIDYTGGLQDIKSGTLRLIGDPETRYREDPVRMVRAVRFAAKLGFNIDKSTEAPIEKLGHLLKDVSNARMFEEVLKLFHSGAGVQVFEKLRHFDLFTYLFPITEQLLHEELEGFPRMMVIEALKSTDQRISEGKSVNPAFLFSAMLWEPMLQRKQAHLDSGLVHQDAFFAAANDVIEQQIRSTAIPKRFTAQMRDIWNLQNRLSKRQGPRAQKLSEHPRFRAAYDFLGVRVAAGESELKKLFDWWTEYQEKDPVDQVAFANAVEKKPQKGRRRRQNRNFYRKRSQKKSDASGSANSSD